MPQLTAIAPRQHEVEDWQVIHRHQATVDRHHWWHVTRNERIEKAVRQLVGGDKTKPIMEIGCGSGNVIGYLYERGYRNLTGWDLDVPAIELGSARYPEVDFAVLDATTQVGEGYTKFEVVSAFDVLEHLDDDVAMIETMTNLCRPGGSVLLTVPCHAWLWSSHDTFWGHRRRYEKAQITKLLENAGLVNVRVSHFMAPLVPILWLTRRADATEVHDAELMHQRYLEEAKLPHPAVNSIVKSILRTENNLGIDIGLGTSLIAMGTRC